MPLISAPSAESADLDDETEWLHADLASHPGSQPLYFVKEAGAWAAVPFPAPSPAHCLEGMHETARAILAAQQKYFAANGKYSKSFGKLDYDGDQEARRRHVLQARTLTVRPEVRSAS